VKWGIGELDTGYWLLDKDHHTNKFPVPNSKFQLLITHH